MDQFLGKLSLYDIIVMIIPGGTILLFFLDYYGVDLLFNGSYDISSLAVFGAVVASYIIGMGNHVIAKKLWRIIRNNSLLLSYSLEKAKNEYTKELNNLMENVNLECCKLDLQSKSSLEDKYYQAYSYVLEKSKYGDISIIEGQVAFLQSMIIPMGLMLFLVSKHNSLPLFLGCFLLLFISLYLIFDRTMLIHKQVWEYYEYTRRINKTEYEDFGKE
ncbi:hypothetical protein [Prevotella sp.]|uniref:hypothetical protein n=1 Tax=Prevotella sp. TaxID=59823 RepID=UPI0025E886C9|nr:hypothetical protein [Prevotella sp.]